MSERTAGAEKPTLLQIQLSDPILHLIEDVMYRLDVDLTNGQWDAMHEAIEEAITRNLPEVFNDR